MQQPRRDKAKPVTPKSTPQARLGMSRGTKTERMTQQLLFCPRCGFPSVIEQPQCPRCGQRRCVSCSD